MKLHINNVVANYGKNRVLDGVSWTIDQGVTGLLGPNGAGKSTLLHLMAGIMKPVSGTIMTTAENSAANAERQGSRVGLVPQHFSFAGEMRVLDTVSYACWVNGVPRRSCAGSARRALGMVDLTDRADVRVKTLSGGQRQRLGVATALGHEPELLLLDEPTVGLDPGQRLKLREVISTIGERLPVVISTHLVEDVTHLCRRVGILAAGKMAFDDEVEKLAVLVDEEQGTPARGSAFEQAYSGVIARLGGQRD